MRFFKLEICLTCDPEKNEKSGEIHCDEYNSCDECLREAFALTEKIIGPEFKINRIKIVELIDLKK